MPDAKRSGFTDCEANYHGYTCKKVDVALYGLKATTAALTMDVKPNLQREGYYLGGASSDVRALKPEQLSFKSVRLTFTPADLKAFGNSLAQDGWKDRQASSASAR